MVGCLRRLSRSLSRWMVSRGARCFVFLGRTGLAKPAARQIVQELKETGARCTVVTGDDIVGSDSGGYEPPRSHLQAHASRALAHRHAGRRLFAIYLGLCAISELGYLHGHSEIGELLLRKGIRPLPENEALQAFDFALFSEIDQEQTVPRYRLAQCHILNGLENTGLQDHRKQGFTGFWHNLDNIRFSVLINTLQRQASQSEDGINTPTW
ncbi:hypothetical protein BO79DRAFT_250449 [Aspergillus costaricaensis CBS 115574]|uniref:Uncharacterized protein n=1 Tax=Aspergillus costaricaensis CBS 115574 TaxID=1448317 RepID=A0ACD1IUM8_9EURO|nr:hypothetical protein BO79DRAFT_250449 [Aspergillus costaricaensis CBS 115574]RAK93824.1 hypothetical protein BO79DRAFT_250449 [Aspergillus costaricaensis CBS 115574]